MKKYKAIIFDIDGTLTSTNQLIFDSFNFIANKYLNRHFKDEELIALFGPTEDVILKEWCKDQYDEARKEYYEYYENNHDIVPFFDGMHDILEFLKSKNVILAIFTGKGRDTSLITLKHFNILHYFNMIVTGDDVTEHKPSSEGILKFIEEFKVDNEHTLMIGDAPSDIIASRSAGVDCASVVWDSYAKEKVFSLNNNLIFESVEDLFSFLKDRV